MAVPSEATSWAEPTPREPIAPPVGKIDAIQGLRVIAVLLVVRTHSIVAAEYASATKQGAFFHLKSFDT